MTLPAPTSGWEPLKVLRVCGYVFSHIPRQSQAFPGIPRHSLLGVGASIDADAAYLSIQEDARRDAVHTPRTVSSFRKFPGRYLYRTWGLFFIPSHPCLLFGSAVLHYFIVIDVFAAETRRTGPKELDSEGLFPKGKKERKRKKNKGRFLEFAIGDSVPVASHAMTTVGVLALQGGFAEHLGSLRKAADQLPVAHKPRPVINFIEVRTPEQLALCDALILPGGESTTLSFVAAQSGLLGPLREFVKVSRKPVWGTCAGLILLCEQASATKMGGQELIGGLNVKVHRNHFGRQLQSFVRDIDLPFLEEGGAKQAPFPAVFIRAPVVDQMLHTAGATENTVEIMAKLPSNGGGDSIIAVRQGNVFGTSFHPELTDDIRIHVWWLEQVTRGMAIPI
ncbi:SNO glutamine amidotransferase family-domain-containing protein [Xylaria intraflava]|nr:SNO glutamine amidotransferase family-domain-containing protein [Xylaria intraflava]